LQQLKRGSGSCKVTVNGLLGSWSWSWFGLRQMMQFAVGQVDSQLAAPMRHLLWLGKPKRKTKIRNKA